MPFGTRYRQLVPCGTYMLRKVLPVTQNSDTENRESNQYFACAGVIPSRYFICKVCNGETDDAIKIRVRAGDGLERHNLLESTAAIEWLEHSTPRFLGADGLIIKSISWNDAQSIHLVDCLIAGASGDRANKPARNQFRYVGADGSGVREESRAVPTKGAGTASVPDDVDRLDFLASSARLGRETSDPLQNLDAAVRKDAFELLGGDSALGRTIMSEEDLVEAIVTGFPADVLVRLRDAGYPYTVLDQVVAPRRTLMRRKSTQQRLTRSESDAAWRLAHVLSMATRVFDGRKAALAWLSRTKGAFRGRTPIELLETSVGTSHVERILRTLDWGDVA